MHMPIENLLLEELPDCQTGLGNSVESETIFDNGNTNNLAFWCHYYKNNLFIADDEAQ
jgi:hypothetical protein